MANAWDLYKSKTYSNPTHTQVSGGAEAWESAKKNATRPVEKTKKPITTLPTLKTSGGTSSTGSFDALWALPQKAKDIVKNTDRQALLDRRNILESRRESLRSANVGGVGTFSHANDSNAMLYLVKEFERLKTEEMKQLGWDIKRNLAKINYRIHTDAIKENLIPPELSAKQISMVYASEADVLNMALFGMTAKQWRDSHPDLKGNIRDYANVSQLVCLSNLENLNAVFINEGMSQAERLTKLNAIAISQMEILTQDHRIEALEAHSEDLSPME